DVNAAFTKLRQNPGESLHFFFCEEGADGVPVLLFSQTHIPSTETKKILGAAKKPGKAAGHMTMDKTGNLTVTPDKPCKPLAKGVQIVARNHNCMPHSITVTPAGRPDGAYAGSEADAGGRVVDRPDGAYAGSEEDAGRRPADAYGVSSPQPEHDEVDEDEDED